MKALPQSLLFMLFYSPMRSYAGANVKIYRESDNSKVTEFNIPITQSGMPTLYYYATLSPGQYYVKIRSDNLSTYSTGGFTVSYISGTYNH